MRDLSAWSSKFPVLFCVILSSTMGAGASSGNDNFSSNWNSPRCSDMQPLDFDIVCEDSDTTSCSKPNVEERMGNAFDDQRRVSHIYKSNFHELPWCDVETNEIEDEGEPPSIISSSVLYDGECYFSAEAMMCNGGGWDTTMNRYINYDDQFDFEAGDSSDEDDDNDDDNDGHSSMLSTASLRLTKSTTRRKKVRCHAGSGQTSSKRHHKRSTIEAVRLNNSLRLRLCTIKLHDKGRTQQHLNHWFSQRQRALNFAFLRQRVISAPK